MTRRRTQALPLIIALGLLARGSAQAPVPCFPTVLAPPWTGTNVGLVQEGASRPVSTPGAPRGTSYELCSMSQGFQREADSLRFLYQDTRANFEMIARVDDIQGSSGLGGVMARVDPRRDGSAYIQISAVLTGARGVQLISSYREETGAPMQLGNTKPIQATLPIFLRVSREGTMVSTAYSRDGRSFESHLELDADATDLAYTFLRAGMVHSSANEKLPGTALFSLPSLSQREEIFPPVLVDVLPRSSPIEGGVEVSLIGERLEDVIQVTLAGVEAKIADRSPERLIVVAGPSKAPVYGDVRVVTRTSSEVLQDAFSYFGTQFIRGDFNGSGKVDLGDVVAGLSYLFRGGPASPCAESADFNGDKRDDIGDTVYLLGHLFLGTLAPPSPYPAPGVGASPHLPCGLPPGPVITEISQNTLKEGDEVVITGRGFSQDPERNVLFFGSTRAEILEASENRLLARVGSIAENIDASVALIPDVFADISILFNCKATRCRYILIGPAVFAALPRVRLIGSDQLRVVGKSTFDMKQNSLLLSVPRRLWKPTETYDINVNLFLPVVQGLSQGSRIASFEFRHSSPKVTYEEWLGALADRLERVLIARQRRDSEIAIEADSRGEQIILKLHPQLTAFLDSSILESLVQVLFRPPVGRCGPTNLHPVNDVRAFGWCRFEELIATCNGLPKWEYFIPKGRVFQASSDIFPLPSPATLSPSEKTVMYNKPAYCFVRNEDLWNRCKLIELEANGNVQIPHFPRSAIVIKTHWRTAGSLPAVPNPNTTYYHYDRNGTRQYLTAFHFTTKDVDNWYWADFYVPSPGVGGCGGWNSDRPASIGGVWANYYMCTNLEPDEEICGNLEFPECGVSTCTACHQHTPDGSGPFGTGASLGSLGLDFLFSMNDGPQDPPGCP
ncbi:MAG TPA: IPT/TIG domain-containing protein [Planctomycetota bacterium]|nr:IPT/TIG domain-containing protein [Planctomycetota bacterium]